MDAIGFLDFHLLQLTNDEGGDGLSTKSKEEPVWLRSSWDRFVSPTRNWKMFVVLERKYKRIEAIEVLPSPNQ